MKKYLLLSGLFLACLLTTPLQAQQTDFIKQYLERLENSKTYLLLIAEQMPEEHYNYRATPESKSFAENLMHIGWAMDWHSQSLLGGRPARDWETDMELRVGDKTKAEMMATIAHTFDESIKLISEFDVSQLNDVLDYGTLKRTKRQILLLLPDHISHHRGQMLVSMRLNGLVPPRYMLYQ